MITTLLVGFGFSAKTFHLPFLETLDDYGVTGVVSSRPDAVAETLPGAAVWPSLSEALKSASFDLVIITTPNHLHASQARDALNAGSHVLVEKPFTLSSEEAIQLVALADSKNLSLTVYQNRRFDGDFMTLQTLLSEGRLGTVRRLQSRFDRFRPFPRDRWRENAGPGSGITWDLGPHLLDQALVLFGMPDALYADIQILRDGGKSDDCFDISLYYPSVTVKLGSSPFQAGPTLRFDVQGDAGSYRKYHLDPQEAGLRDGVSPADAGIGETHASDHGVFYNETSSKEIETLPGNYLRFYQALIATIHHQEKSPAPAEDAVHVIRLLEIARKSAQTGTQKAVK
ncbi:Gfo/Idh/MocA family oxidoreductase [Alteromonas halophila]|uniref:Oxidoreductase n=1 Tax=Alteromonas halophila TaxID=516698 RepID=A0A918MZT5_9ALTE|nr:Gfo/Idh/MocA family oxidoreductase [Alteromonas halophila]GGW90367.1 oxidoreductase [Alteromonas halophila]